MPRKYCPDCGSEISSRRMFSNMKAPNEHRLGLYICTKCSTKKGKDVVVGILRRKIPESEFFNDIKVVMLESI